LTHVDYRYGNLNDAKRVGKICEEYDIPFFLNTAYTSGLMEIHGGKLRTDFIVGSGHKSWSATAPIGVLAMNYERSNDVLKKSRIRGDWSGRAFTKKEIALFGCSPVYGLPLITLMASFPHVAERVKKWDEEVRKARYLADELEKIEGVRLLGDNPTNHTLMHFESPTFHLIAVKHSKKGYFLYRELKRRNVIGIHPGMTKNFKLNTYGLDENEIEIVINAFKDIAEKYGLEVEN
jgi:Sep-tRNA:Cys-tRNA synthetase